MDNHKEHFPIWTIIFFISLGLIASLFNHWEPRGESWGYWTFLRIFSQTGQFIIPDRSPAYVLYLNLFSWLGYPNEIIAEYFVSSLIAAVSLVILFRRYLSWPWLTLAVILWIPFLQVGEPPVQKLALACACFAVALRETNPSRFRIAFSYSFLALSIMFRGTSVIYFAVFLMWDLVGIIKNKLSFKKFLPTRFDWPIAIVILLFIWVHTAQSPHRWNNPWIASNQWFVSQDNSLADQGFLGEYNAAYIANHLKNDKQDFYFTNKLIFNGATTMIGGIKANPKFVFKQIAANIKNDVIVAVKLTLFPDLFDQKFPKGSFWWYPVHLFITAPVFLLFLYGVFRGCKTDLMRCFSLANVLMIAALVLAFPKDRYMHPMIPLLFVSTSWFVSKFQEMKIDNMLRNWFVFLLIIIFSRGGIDWFKTAINISRDITQGTLSVLQDRPSSMVLAKSQIAPLIENCKGIISLEHSFWAAFTNKPVDQFYDVWEIPPFGSLGHSPYDGLRPDRVDCVIVSNNLRMSSIEGGATNARIRYDQYIEPYVEQLNNLGARTYRIGSYGTLTILRQ